MKTKVLFMTAALFLGLFATGCSKDQSELSLSNINGSATIKGQVTYNSGCFTYNETTATIASAANVTIYVDVNYSEYKTGAAGATRYTTTTNESGEYSVTIPCSVSMGSVSATVIVPSFTAKYGEATNSNGGISYDAAAIYSATTDASADSGDYNLCNIYISEPTTTTLE